jgi:hypothetical protein
LVHAHLVDRLMEMIMNRLSVLLTASAMAAGLVACADGYSGSADSQRSYAYTRAACTEHASGTTSDNLRRQRFDSCMNSRGWSGSMAP